MKPIPLLADCPHCRHPLTVRALECVDCGLRVEAAFQPDPLHRLGGDELHFVRLFLHCEGSIRDMEKALGISYPTVKARLAAINAKLAAPAAAAPEPAPAPAPAPPERSVLDRLADGEVDFATALKSLKKGKPDAR